MKIKKIFAVITAILMLALVGCGTGGQALDAQERTTHSPHPYPADRNLTGIDAGRQHESGTREGINWNISSEETSIPSDQYPETKAVQVQEAKFIYVVEDGEINVDEGDIPAQLQQFSPDQIKNALRHQLDGISQDELQRFSPDRLEQMVRDQLGEAAPTPGEQPEQATPEAPQPDTERETPQATPDREAPEAREPVADTPAPTPAPEQARPEAPTPAPTQPEAEPEAEQRQEQAPEARAEGLSDFEAQVVELTNAERRKNGLSDLQADTQLSSVARKKSTDMQQNNYFSHTSPTYGSPFDMMRDQGVSYTAAAENIAQGQRTPQEVVQAWMNSEGHRKNIMNGNFTHIGVGYEQNGHHWTQMFITK